MRSNAGIALLVVIMLIVLFSSGCKYGSFASPKKCSSNSDCDDKEYACASDGYCHVCGTASSRPCCDGNKCSEGFLCVNNICHECGARRQYCCDNKKCDEGLECKGGFCVGCGAVDEECCPGKVCEKGLGCSKENICRPCFMFSEHDTSELASACGSRG